MKINECKKKRKYPSWNTSQLGKTTLKDLPFLTSLQPLWLIGNILSSDDNCYHGHGACLGRGCKTDCVCFYVVYRFKSSTTRYSLLANLWVIHMSHHLNQSMSSVWQLLIFTCVFFCFFYSIYYRLTQKLKESKWIKIIQIIVSMTGRRYYK